ncbi:hypothetical protein ABZ926_14205 [Streptomyces litmocidini]|uniref:hypothetical protein n=1 Tax=Streptomyces litmocidini TaxID=67318 RepID=UPI003404397A
MQHTTPPRPGGPRELLAAAADLTRQRAARLGTPDPAPPLVVIWEEAATMCARTDVHALVDDLVRTGRTRPGHAA